MTLLLVFFLVAFAAASFLVETEHWVWASLCLAASVAVANYFDWVDVVGFVGLLSIAYVAGYLVIGVVWSFVKWFSHLHRFRDRYRLARERAQQASRQPDPASESSAFTHRARYHTPLPEIPTAANSRGKIIGWMAYWPFSLFGTLLNDPVRRLFNFLYDSLRSLYQRLADHVLRNDIDKLSS